MLYKDSLFRYTYEKIISNRRSITKTKMYTTINAIGSSRTLPHHKDCNDYHNQIHVRHLEQWTNLNRKGIDMLFRGFNIFYQQTTSHVLLLKTPYRTKEKNFTHLHNITIHKGWCSLDRSTYTSIFKCATDNKQDDVCA